MVKRRRLLINSSALRREQIRSLCYFQTLAQMKVVDAWTAASRMVRKAQKKWIGRNSLSGTTHELADAKLLPSLLCLSLCSLLGIACRLDRINGQAPTVHPEWRRILTTSVCPLDGTFESTRLHSFPAHLAGFLF
ncbi:hypothetical protein KC354_g48 [Hortaea werneckii]|nr:hypothetical protein KC354_g48 [Hortaea werneckii]